MTIEAPADWAVAKLGEVTEVLLSNVDKKSREGEEPVRLCNYMDVYSNQTITSRVAFMEATASPAQVEKYRLLSGDVMITKDSEDPLDIAVPAVVTEDLGEDVLCGYHLALLRPSASIDGRYLAWALRSWPVNNQFARRANGTTRFGLTLSVIRSVEIPLPPLPEQIKIGAVLSAIDAQIESAEAIVEQSGRVKAGLLQDLLSGTVRVSL